MFSFSRSFSFFNRSFYYNIEQATNKINNIINSARNNPSSPWLLQEKEFHTFTAHNKHLSKNGTQQQILDYFAKLREGFKSTTDGTPAHGIYVTLINDFWSLCKPNLRNEINSFLKQHELQTLTTLARKELADIKDVEHRMSF